MRPNSFTVSRSLFVALMLLLSNAALAASSKVITRNIAADDLQDLRLDISVAELDMEISDGDLIELEIRLEAQRRFFGLRAGSVDDVDLETRRSGTELTLRIDERDVEQHWTVIVPAHLALRIELGVGEVRIDGLNNDLDMEVGVGEVRVDAVEEAFGSIELQTGVGEATISGMRSPSDNERNFISADAYYSGNGEHAISIELGVGEIQVRRD